jgi:hypothetical protein
MGDPERFLKEGRVTPGSKKAHRENKNGEPLGLPVLLYIEPGQQEREEGSPQLPSGDRFTGAVRRS